MSTNDYTAYLTSPKKYLAKMGLATAVSMGFGEINRARHKLNY